MSSWDGPRALLFHLSSRVAILSVDESMPIIFFTPMSVLYIDKVAVYHGDKQSNKISNM